MDARIQALEAEVLSLKTQRNTLVPLCSLPVELLVKTLSLCSWKDLSVMRIICKGSKRIIDGESSLWSTPPLGYPAAPDHLTELFIHRSASTLLTFDQPYIGNASSYSVHQLDIIAAQLQRTKRLKAIVNNGNDLAPLLENLHKTNMACIENLLLHQ
jgi:hypothetical protein